LHLLVSNPVEAASEVLQAHRYNAQETEQRRGNGTGLKNLYARFHALYQDQSRIESQRTSDRFIVQLALPYRAQEASHE
jgi:LytS/YehU family sensor histidine kinase